MDEIYGINEFDALLVTDMQKDFLPGGALPVENGDLIIPVINNYIKRFVAAKAHIIASRDWHPENHISFKGRGGPWPAHCVQQTEGAEFNPKMRFPSGTIIISKATDPEKEAYSVFDETNFDQELRMLNIKRLFIGGIATDYCVLNTVIDARKLDYEAVVLTDATLGINVNKGDVERAFELMFKMGAQQANSSDFPDSVDSLPIEKLKADELAEKPATRALVKKKARMRPRGSAKRLPTEQ